MAKISNLKTWRDYYRELAAKTNEFPIALQPQSPADDVLLALSKYSPAIEELRQASQLPYSRFPLDYDTEDPAEILLPHLSILKQCTLALQLRAIAELQNDQSDQALADLKLALRLTESIHTEPFLITHLVRIAMVQITLQPIYEGLAEHKWSDAQLAELDSELAGLDFLSDYRLAMRGEMVLCQEGVIDYLRRHPEQLSSLKGYVGADDDNSSSSGTILNSFSFSSLIPNGWFYQNQLRCSRFMVQQYVPLADLEHRIVSPASLRRAETALDLEFRHSNPYNRLEAMFLPSLGGAVKRFAYAQSSVDLARVAIALERYRLAQGEYPESLDALTPQLIKKIPHDVINGQPLHYRRTDDGQFVLYSVGWNEKDDGGVVVFNGKRTDRVDISQGDWVWRYPKAE
jgi:tetratricopeptide (TPR) repeat protein